MLATHGYAAPLARYLRESGLDAASSARRGREKGRRAPMRLAQRLMADGLL